MPVDGKYERWYKAWCGGMIPRLKTGQKQTATEEKSSDLHC
jgi:hypothetical protein